MKQLLQYPREKTPTARTLPDPVAGPGMVLVQNRASLISAGTERQSMLLARASLARKAQARPDLVRQVLQKAMTEGVATTWRKVRDRLAEPLIPGYSSAGIIIGFGEDVADFRVGDRVACSGQNYASHAGIVCVPKNLVCPLPPQLPFAEGAFVSVGAVALQGVRTAAPQLGETVAVIGLGLLGQLTAQLLAAQGCRVVGVDPDEDRRQLAAQNNQITAVAPEAAARTVLEITAGMGADSVIICAASESDSILQNAAAIARDRAIVVAVGAIPLNVPRAEFYRKELQLRLSRSYGPGRYDPVYEERGIDYPAGYVRWSENRNMRAFLELAATPRLNLRSLITHRFGVDEAEEAYNTLDKPHALGVLFEYPENSPPTPIVRRFAFKKAVGRKDQYGVGFWGCGRFATGVLAPIFTSHPYFSLVGACARTPASADRAASRHKFSYATCRSEELLLDSDIDIIVIATPHRDHAAMATAALAAGKIVFLEKPAATGREELRTLAKAVSQKGGRLQVGFNRRYAPAVRDIRAAFASRTGPKTIIYRVNAGPPPVDGWLADPAQGGRLIGEVCHFADTVLALTESWPRRVWAERLGPAGTDGVALQVTLVDGSVATILYATDGHPRTPKEQVEILGCGITARIDDYSRWTIATSDRTHERKTSQDKGHAAQIAALHESLKEDRMVAGNWAAAVSATEITLAAEESLRTGQPVTVDPWL